MKNKWLLEELKKKLGVKDDEPEVNSTFAELTVDSCEEFLADIQEVLDKCQEVSESIDETLICKCGKLSESLRPCIACQNQDALNMMKKFKNEDSNRL